MKGTRKKSNKERYGSFPNFVLNDRKVAMPVMFAAMLFFNFLISILFMWIGVYYHWIIFFIGLVIFLFTANKTRLYIKYKMYNGFGMNANEIVWNKKNG